MSTTLAAGTATSGAALSSDTSGILQLQSGSTPTTAVTIDTAQNVGVGVTPSAWGSFKVLEFPNGVMFGSYTGGFNQAYMGTNFYFNGTNFIYKQNDYAVKYEQTSGTHQWYTAPSGTAGNAITFTQAMTLNNSGYLGIGATSPGYPLTVSLATQNLIQLQNTNAGTKFWYEAVSSGNTYYFLNGSNVGVQIADGGNSWSSYSDSRLKNVTGTYANPLSDIAQLQPVKFTWKSDTTNKPCVGVIAQSVQTVVPEAVDQFKLANADELNDQTEYLSVRYTELIPLMIASIQALTAEVTALKAKVGA